MTRQASSIAYLCLQATREGQGSFAHVHEIIRGLERRGHAVELFQPRYAGDDKPLPGAIGRAVEFWRVQRRLRRRARNVSAVYIRAHFAAMSTHRWARSRGIPVVHEVNGSYEDLFAAWPWTRLFKGRFIGLMRDQYTTADVLITVTDDLAAWLAEETGRFDVKVVSNGADTELFRPGAQPLAGVPESYVLFFGAFAVWQGIDTLIAATLEPEWPVDVSLVFAGDGAMRPAIEEAATRNHRVRYLGTVPYRDMPGLIGGGIAGVSPQGVAGGRSSTGLAPLKVYETLACGVPAIVTDFPVQADLVRGSRAGLVVPPDDPRALARAVGELAGDPAKAREMGANGRKVMMAEHSWDARAAATSEILGPLLARE